MSVDIGFASQAPSLPSGGGVTGLGETFTPDLAHGTGTYAVPLDIPNGPNDCAPRLTLRYSSSDPNGPFGVGWSLPLPRLLRSTAHGRPSYGPGDRLVLEGSGPLVRLPDGSYRPEVDTGDWRIAELGDGFLVTDRAGKRYRLGTDDASRIAGSGARPWSWLLREIEDNLGYVVQFTWREDGAQRYLQHVDYGVYRVSFLYQDRPDPLRFARGGFLLETRERCHAIELHLPADAQSLVRRWSLTYTHSEPAGTSLLSGVTLTGYDAQGNALAAPALTLGYQKPEPARLKRLPVDAGGLALPGLDDGRVEIVDWQGDGLPDVLEVDRGGSARIWPNAGGRFGFPRSVGVLPQLAAPTSRVGILDLNGDGIADLVPVDVPLSGYQPRTESGFARPVRWTRAPAVSLISPGVRIADFDGDGLVELLWSSGRSLLLARRDEQRGWQEHPTVVAVSAHPDSPPANLSDPRVFCADMTGDGTADLVRVDGGGVTYWPYQDTGGFGAAVRMAHPPRLPITFDPLRLFVVDIDADGCADIVLVDDGCVRWWPNCAGASFGVLREVRNLPTGSMRTVRVADMAGSGSPALCWSATLPSGRAAWFALDLLGGVRPGLLTSIDNGLGSTTTIRYTTSATEAVRDRLAGVPWTARHPLALPVVSEIVTTDSVTGSADTTRYRYHDGRYDGVLREVCGFARVEQEDVGRAGVATLLTTRWFATGLDARGHEPQNAPERRRWRAIRGRLLREERAGADGRPLEAVTHEWDVQPDGSSIVPRLSRTTTWTYEGATTPVSWLTTEWRAWDADGNVTEVVETAHEAEQAAPTRTLRTRTSYALDPTGRYRQRVSRVRQEDGDGRLLADTVTEYDGLPYAEGAEAVGRDGLITARWGLALPDELVTEVYGDDPPDLAALGYQRRPWGAGWWIRIGAYQRATGPAGLRGVITGPRGSSTTFTFDATECHPERVVDALGNTLEGSFDPRSYRPLSLIDPAGGTSHVIMDPLGRVVAQVLPGDTPAEPSIAYEYRTASIPVEVVVRRRTAANAAQSVERQVLDGLGRVIERRWADADVEVREEAIAIGPRDLAVRRYLPHRAGSDAWQPPDPNTPHLTIEYDPLGRPLKSTRADGASATLRYLPGVTEEADEADNDPASPHHGTLTRRTIDATGRVTSIEQRLGTQVITSNYTYDTKGQLIQHSDAAGNHTRFTYDLFGRTLRVVRPEATQVAVLDAAGNTVEARAGDRRVLRQFDIVDRLIAVRHDDAASPPLVRYTYADATHPEPHATGRLIEVSHGGGELALSYDARGRIVRKSMRQSASSPARELRLAYRADNLLESVTYPAAEAGAPYVARYRYDRRRLLRSIDGLINHIERDPAGRVTRTWYANGVEERNEYDSLTGWLRVSRIEREGVVLRQVALEHDPVGNVTAQRSPDPMLDWSYTFDDLYRLIQASATGISQPHSYSYDASGNLLSMSDVGTFTYGAGGAAPTCLTGAGAETYSYDTRGHLLQAPWGVHTVDAEGRLRLIDHAAGGTTAFTYDHEGTLVRRVSTDAGGALEDIWSPDRMISYENGELVAQVSDGTRIIARVQADGSRVWLHADYLGSLVLVTDDAGSVVRAVHYGPYGDVLSVNGAHAVPQGYATSSAASAGLTLLGARWYCPRIGRFISPDAVVGNVFDPLAWNPYAYAGCNPVSVIDPSGRSALKIFLGIVAAVLIIAVLVVVTVLTAGAGGFGAAAIIAGSVKVTWGAIFAATVVGVLVGGTVGALSVKQSQGGDAGDILLGALVGAAVGGWAAFGAAFASPFVSGFSAQYLYVPKLLAKTLAGSMVGAVQNAAVGFATGYAESLTDSSVGAWDKVLAYAGYGALSGAVAKFAGGLLHGSGEAPTWMKAMHGTGPSSAAEVTWMIGFKSAGKAFDKTLGSIVEGKVTGQGELALDLLVMGGTPGNRPDTFPAWP